MNDTSGLRSVLKAVPFLVPLVRFARQNGRKLKVAVLRSILASSTSGVKSRAVYFDAMEEEFALANHPRESYVVNTSDRMIGRTLFARGDFDFAKLEKGIEILRSRGWIGSSDPVPVLFDIGSNIGSIGIPAVKRGLVARCVAAEPDPDNFRLLHINVLLNGVEDRFDLHQCAIGDRDARIEMTRSTENHGDHKVAMAGEMQGKQNGEHATIPMKQLDSLVENVDMAGALLWMDIQGYEGYALIGAKKFLEAKAPIILEFYKKDLDRAGCFDILLDELSAGSYSAFYDLNEETPQPIPVSRDALLSLAQRLEADGIFTDILLVAETAGE